MAIDGAKLKASNNTRRHYTAEQLRELLAKIEARIDEYLGELDAQDAQAEGVPAAPGRDALREKKPCCATRGRYEGQLDGLAHSGQNEVSLTDADIRKMKGAHGGHFLGYMVQVAAGCSPSVASRNCWPPCASPPPPEAGYCGCAPHGQVP